MKVSIASASNHFGSQISHTTYLALGSEILDHSNTYYNNQFAYSYSDSYGQNEYQGLFLSQWILENGAASHMTHDISSPRNPMAYNGINNVTEGKGNSLSIAHAGNSRVDTFINSFKIKYVLHATILSSNLISIQMFCLDNNIRFEFHSNCFYVKNIISRKILLRR